LRVLHHCSSAIAAHRLIPQPVPLMVRALVKPLPVPGWGLQPLDVWVYTTALGGTPAIAQVSVLPSGYTCGPVMPYSQM
jgi:hypothetical protein